MSVVPSLSLLQHRSYCNWYMNQTVLDINVPYTETLIIGFTLKAVWFWRAKYFT